VATLTTRQIETELGTELAQIEAALERERSTSGEDLDVQAQAAKRARDALPPRHGIPGDRARGRPTT
jgi:hypothetical protein